MFTALQISIAHQHNMLSINFYNAVQDKSVPINTSEDNIAAFEILALLQFHTISVAFQKWEHTVAFYTYNNSSSLFDE